MNRERFLDHVAAHPAVTLREDVKFAYLTRDEQWGKIAPVPPEWRLSRQRNALRAVAALLAERGALSAVPPPGCSAANADGGRCSALAVRFFRCGPRCRDHEPQRGAAAAVRIFALPPGDALRAALAESARVPCTGPGCAGSKKPVRVDPGTSCQACRISIRELGAGWRPIVLNSSQQRATRPNRRGAA